MSLVKSATERASAKVADLESTVARWEVDGSAAAAELEDLQARVGDEVLDDEAAAGRLTEQMAALQSRIAVAKAATQAATRRLEAAHRDLLRAQAGELREQAKRLRADADKRQTTTDRLLRELREHEGVEFDVKVLAPASGVGHGMAPWTETAQLRGDAGRMEGRATALDAAADGGTGDVVAQHAAALATTGA